MQGRKPEPDNLHQHPTAERQLTTAQKAALIDKQWERLANKSLRAGDERSTWKRIAPELAAVGRLGPLYLDVVLEFCRVTARLAEMRETLDREEWTYVVSGRNGQQIKSRPQVAQCNEYWRQWRSLVSELGLSPAAERGIKLKQLGLFDEDPWNKV